jgi:hypothetical protein
MNQLTNARSATTEQRAEFRRVTDAISRMLKCGDLRLGTTAEGLRSSTSRVLAIVAPGALASGDGQLVAQALELDPAKTSFELMYGLQHDSGSIAVAPRSLLALLSYMSNYVEAPAEHAGLVWPTDARAEAEPLIRIHSSSSRPDLGDPAVYYRGHWFYVQADDLRSRNTLYLIRLLFNLQAQAASGADTVQLTLPVK